MLGYFSKDFSVGTALGAFTAAPLSEVLPADPDTQKGGLFISNWQPPSQIQTLQTHKIGFVLSALDTFSQPYASYPQHGIVQKILPVRDTSEFDISQCFEEAYEWIRSGLEKGNVLVHCAAGVSRSATFILVYLMRSRQEGFENSLAYLRTKRPICNPNQGFQRQLKEYASKLGLADKNEPHSN